MSSDPSREPSRRFQILVGFAAILGVTAIIAACWLGRILPGFLGEWFGMLVGLATTPVLMEASFFFLGLTTVLLINHWRRVREGDEFVYLEQAEGPGTAELPESARWAVYSAAPLDGVTPDLLTQAEGAVAVGDYESALESIGQMDDLERLTPAVLALRIRIARATGHEELAERLEARLVQSADP